MSRHALTADSTMILPPLSSSQPIPPTPSPSTFLFSYHSSLLSKRSQQSRLSSYTAHTLTSAQSALLTRPSSPATSRLPLPLHALDAAHYRLCVERELLVRSALSRREQHAAAAHERVQATLRRDRRLDEEHTRAYEREVQRMQQQAAHVLAAECLTAHRAAVPRRPAHPPRDGRCQWAEDGVAGADREGGRGPHGVGRVDDPREPRRHPRVLSGPLHRRPPPRRDRSARPSPPRPPRRRHGRRRLCWHRPP